MDARKLVLGAPAVFVVMFGLSWVWHEALMADLYRSTPLEPMRDSPLIASIAGGYALLSLVMAWMYPKGYEGGRPWIEGLTFGAVIGILWILPFQLVLYGVMEGPLGMVAVDAGWHVIEQGLGGLVLGWIHGRPVAG